MRVQNNASIFCNFQFAVLPLTASDFTKEIYDVRFYNKIIKTQQAKINNLETELSTIKLSYDPVYFYAHLAHNNELAVKFSNDPKYDVTHTHGGFEIKTNNNLNLCFKEPGLYHISYLDGYKTSSTESSISQSTTRIHNGKTFVRVLLSPLKKTLNCVSN